MDESTLLVVYRHFEAALRLEEADRQHYFDQLEEDDASIADKVRRLVDCHIRADAGQFLRIDDEFSPTLAYPDDSKTPEQEPAKSTRAIPAAIANYKVIELLGEGGMGTVYRVFHSETDREVALKVVHAGLLSNSDQLLRFENEVKAVASMQHENIVPLYDVGQHDGIPFFTMAVVEGKSLLRRLAESPLPQRDAALLLKVLAQAIQYAHSRGIIHRDLKPGNILIDENGKPWLADFGIAKRVDDDNGQTQTGQVVGTAGYISPEQIDHVKKVGPAADVYGLGAILYHCLTGSAPFKGRNVVRTLNDVRLRMPRPPREFDASIDRDLELICMRCLQKEPDDRYESAEALSDDLNRFLNHEPISSARSSWQRTIGKIIARREITGDLLSAGAARWSLIVTAPMHATILALIVTDQSNVYLWTLLLVGSVAQSLVNYRFHWSHYWQLEVIERQSGIIQLAVSFAFLVLFLIHGPLTTDAPIRDFLQIYPPLIIVLGVATFAHAGIHSGRWLLSGGVCFPAAFLASRFPDAGPLVLTAVSAMILLQADSQLRQSITAASTEPFSGT